MLTALIEKYAPTVAACLIAAVVGAGAGVYVTRLAFQAKIADMVSDQATKEATAAESTRRLERRYAAATTLADTYYKDLQYERRKNSDLVADLSGPVPTVRVRVPATCTPSTGSDTSPSSVDNGKTTAELDPAFAAALARITADGDEAIHQLTALQAYVESLLKAQEQEGNTDGSQ